jgi:hypothetical protein
MTTNEAALVEETKALIDEVESGATAHAAWVAIQDRVKQLYEDHTQAEISELIGKNPSWVSDLIRWEPSSRPTPFGGDHRATKNRDTVGAKTALRDPDKRAKVLGELSAHDKAAVAADALADPDVRDVVASNPKLSKPVTQASADASEALKSRVKDRGRRPDPDTVDEYLEVTSHLDAIHSHTRLALRALQAQDIGDWPDDLRADARGRIDHDIDRLEFLSEALQGITISDEQIADLLAE